MIDGTGEDRRPSQSLWEERGHPLRPGDPHQVGSYGLLRILGEGGMGRVYLARAATGRLVAVKLIREEVAQDAEFRRRFRREVERAKQVPSFSTAEVLDADPDHDPPYLVVEFVDGPSLEEVVLNEGPFTAANLRGLAIGMAAALRAIHDADVIHRDLKPSNVLLARGSPKVIDFGIARPAVDPTTLTDPRRMVGTVAYMSPERFYADERKALTAAADIFAWGAVVTFAGTGRIPFRGDSTGAVVGRIIHGTPDLSGLTDPLRGLVELALAKDPAERPTARQLVDQLTAAVRRPARAGVSDQPVDATSEHSVGFRRARAVPRLAMRSRWLPGVTALLALAVVTVAQGWLGTGTGDRTPSPSTTASPVRPRLLWTFPTGRAVTGQPVLWGNLLCFGSKDGTVYAVDAHTPNIQWEYHTAGKILQSPQVRDGVLYTTSLDGHVYALSAGRGRLRWKRPTDGAPSSSPRISADGRIYVGTKGGYLNAYEPSGTRRPRVRTDGAVTTAPTIVGDVVLVGTRHSRLRAIAAGGGLRWEKSIRGLLSWPPVVAEGVVYVASNDEQMHSFDTRTGERRWRFPTRGVVSATPALANGIVYFGSADGHVYAVNARSGVERWRFSVEGGHHRVDTPPTLMDGVLYISNHLGRIYALDAATGHKQWEYETGGGIGTPLLVIDDALYAGSTDGHVYALGLPVAETRAEPSTPPSRSAAPPGPPGGRPQYPLPHDGGNPSPSSPVPTTAAAPTTQEPAVTAPPPASPSAEDAVP